jgi:hypothetical protein
MFSGIVIYEGILELSTLERLLTLGACRDLMLLNPGSAIRLLIQLIPVS